MSTAGNDMKTLVMAQLRVAAFDVVKGFGTLGADGSITPLDYNGICELADKLAKWALEQDGWWPVQEANL